MLNLLNFNSKPFKIVGSLFLLYVYIIFRIGPIRVGSVWYIYLLLVMGFTIYAYFEEKKRIERGNERFRGNNLFFRYGRRLSSQTLSIPVKSDWTISDSADFANELMSKIQTAFADFYGETPLNGRQVVTVIGVSDSERPSDNRGFIKISFTGSRGSIFSGFITYQLVGKCVILHRLEYLLGIAQWHEILFFVVSSPIRVWFWIWSWFRGEYSIYSSIAGDIGNDFEVMDTKAYYTSSLALINGTTKLVLQSNGLLDNKIKKQVNQIFNNYGTVNQTGDNNSVMTNIK